MKENLKSPPLDFLQPSVSAKEKHWILPHNGQQKVQDAPRFKHGSKHDPEKRREPKGNGKGSRRSSSSRRNSLERDPIRKTCASHIEKGDCPKGNACDYWHPQRTCMLGSKCACGRSPNGLCRTSKSEIVQMSEIVQFY